MVGQKTEAVMLAFVVCCPVYRRAMITPNKLANALHALQDVIIRGRSMAYEKVDHGQIADLLDTAEYLAGLIYDKEDMTTAFRENLVTLAKKHKCHVALDNLTAWISCWALLSL
ncbi:MAG TPA: hypothetical protein VH280_18555 [Verrucomicrobiae bacterium]|nr:hypothetical protein [Verrucomicrobiae bacterium]